MPDYSHYIGSVFNGSYRLDSLVRVGGMGAVFRASHTRLPRTFAVKVLPLDSQANPELVIRFQREAEITAALHHPHIVQVMDYNVAEIGVPYLVMELLQGIDLRGHLARHSPVDAPFVRTALEQTTQALQSAHDLGIVHRDLKPSNLFLCPRPRNAFHVKVLDFGVSKIVGAHSDVTSTQASIGTPRYMAPEQARGKATEVDARTDIFALCTIVYEMLAGQSPFAADSIPSMLYRIVHEDPDDLSRLRPDLPLELVRAVHAGMAKDKELRYPSMMALWEALEHPLAEAGGIANIPSHLQHAVIGAEDSGSSRTGPPTNLAGNDRPWPSGPTGPRPPSDSFARRTGPALPTQSAATGRLPAARLSPLPTATAGSQANPWPAPPSDVSSQVGTAEVTAPRSDPRRDRSQPGGLSFSPVRDVSGTGGPVVRSDVEAATQIAADLPSAAFTEMPTQMAPDAIAEEPWPFTPEADTRETPMPPVIRANDGVRSKVVLIAGLVTVAVAGLVLALVLAFGGDKPKGGPLPGTKPDATKGHDKTRGQDATAVAAHGDAKAERTPRDAGASRPDQRVEATTRPLALTTKPTGAVVIVAGKQLGSAPLKNVPITTKEARLVLRLPGYQTRVADLPAGEKPLSLTFTLRRAAPRGGRLRVICTAGGQPLWANIVVDGRKRGQSPLVLRVSAGRHTITAKRGGYGAATRQVSVRPGQELGVVIPLTKR